ncbi:DUF1565 domain-containing protein, partial [Corallococcus sp. CA049B]|uniref:DUF1565 domain-containing protein n=1 Tax=Corallococcus sp. CA049B TaxID=2316730 RepID=UPI000EEAAE4E
MRNLWKVGALGAVFGAVLSAGGCSNFDAAFENCQGEGRCGPQATGDGGSDAGDAGDAGDTTPPPCGDGGVDYPDLTGFDNDCDGIDGVADAGYFVDPADGQDDNNGTREKPFKTLDRALREIRDGGTGRNIVYLGTGTYNESAPVVDVPVSLYGGYTWRKNGNPYWDRFLDGGTTTRFNGGTQAFLVRDVSTQDERVVLDSFHIKSLDATEAGQPSIALRALNVRELSLHDMVLESGRGAPGVSGQPGNPGLDGGNGGPGPNADAGVFIGGSDGKPQCGDGFLGGFGGVGSSNGDGSPGSPGQPNTTGGTAGLFAVIDTTCLNRVCRCDAGDGGVGSNGLMGDSGAEGRPGEGMGRIRVADVLWEPDQQGGTGETGLPGHGGGGGGGGGACKENNPAIKK